MNIRIFIPYFGRFPSYFPFFLKSCGYNPEIEFLIFTDQELAGELPQNVKIHNMSFEAFKKMAQSKLALDEHNLKVLTPYKLCDYKPAYGALFSDYLRDADFWGFCDVDLIFGRIFDVLSMEIMQDCDRVLNQGHLTLYRNTPEINHLFEKKLDKGISFRDAALRMKRGRVSIGKMGDCINILHMEIINSCISTCKNADSQMKRSPESFHSVFTLRPRDFIRRDNIVSNAIRATAIKERCIKRKDFRG